MLLYGVWGSNLGPEFSRFYRKLFPHSPATLSAYLNFFHSLCNTLWKITLPLETVTIFSWKSVVIWTMNQTDIHRPTKFPRIICTISHECTVRQQPDPWEKNPVLSVDGVQVYITMGDTWSGWQDNGNIMDPGRSKYPPHRCFRSYRPAEDQIPISGTTYMRLLNCVVLCPPYNSNSWSRNLRSVFYSRDSVFTPPPQSAAVLN